MVRRNRDEQMSIGKEIYEGKYTLDSAAIVYKISKYTARDYLIHPQIHAKGAYRNVR